MTVVGGRVGVHSSLLLFVVAVLMVPVFQLQGLQMMPGDIGDSRLNNYFLEHIYQFLIGRAESLWNTPFFYPFPFVMGFSDNLFGSAPVYLVARALVGKADVAFQCWFYVGYLTNFLAAWWALRRLGGSRSAAAVGALIFAFALPTSAHSNHSQLHYRFGVALSMVFFIEFLGKGAVRSLLWAGFWLAWQFYAGIYMGFFVLLMLVSLLTGRVALALLPSRWALHRPLPAFLSIWRALGRSQQMGCVACAGLLLASMGLLFYPYLKVSDLYGAKRSWDELANGLPRPQSYLMASGSLIWGGLGNWLPAVPMSNEHQMFVGAVPLLLGFGGLMWGSHLLRQERVLMAGALLIPAILTLNVGGASLWQLVYGLPLASAIRVLTRLDQVFLFPLAFGAMLFTDKLTERFPRRETLVVMLLAAFFLTEAAAVRMQVDQRAVWRERLVNKLQQVPNGLPDNAVLFFAQSSEPSPLTEIDAMWAALVKGAPTLNGYSGVFPDGPHPTFGSDCAELPTRVAAYLRFVHQEKDAQRYRAIASRVVPVGLEGCDPSWFETLPKFPLASKVYSPEEIRKVSYSFEGMKITPTAELVRVRVHNGGVRTLSANEEGGRQLRLSWRYLDTEGLPLSAWANVRKNLSRAIAPGESAVTSINISQRPSSAAVVQVTLVQENVFWAHNVGVAPLNIPLGDLVGSPPSGSP
ncbi:hypothetical protein [Hydrogenophaga sp. RWCD_12]|uniref:hypothetical protein n=1 Tax=Hydrogenophaga sp. RWCD_12 TaxID=3391190 RepID=UPI00398538C9